MPATELVIPFVGTKVLLEGLISTWNNWLCHLFSNNVVVSDTTVIGSLVESSWDGYSPAIISGWSATYPDGSNGSFTQANMVQWTATGGDLPATVYGYYVTDTLGNLAWCQNDPNAPVTISAVGQTYVVIPFFDFKSQF